MSETKSNKRRIITTLRARLNEERQERERIPSHYVSARARRGGVIQGLEFALGVVATDEPKVVNKNE
jgi:hypothetical protein